MNIERQAQIVAAPLCCRRASFLPPDLIFVTFTLPIHVLHNFCTRPAQLLIWLGSQILSAWSTNSQSRLMRSFNPVPFRLLVFAQCLIHAKSNCPRARLDRQKKQNEQLASRLLGKNRNKKDRRASAPGPGAVSKAPNAKPGSLASRIGAPPKV